MRQPPNYVLSAVSSISEHPLKLLSRLTDLTGFALGDSVRIRLRDLLLQVAKLRPDIPVLPFIHGIFAILKLRLHCIRITFCLISDIHQFLPSGILALVALAVLLGLGLTLLIRKMVQLPAKLAHRSKDKGGNNYE